MLYPERPIENHLEELHVHGDIAFWSNALLILFVREEVEFELGLCRVLLPPMHPTIYLLKHLPGALLVTTFLAELFEQ